MSLALFAWSCCVDAQSHQYLLAMVADQPTPQASDYPAPPGTPTSQPTITDAAVPPPTYDQAIGQSKTGQQASAGRTAGHAEDTSSTRAAGSSPSSKSPSHDSPQSAARAEQQQQHGSPEAIDRSAEEALQIQVSYACTACLNSQHCTVPSLVVAFWPAAMQMLTKHV